MNPACAIKPFSGRTARPQLDASPKPRIGAPGDPNGGLINGVGQGCTVRLAFRLLHLHEPLDDGIEVRVACAETPCQPIPTALCDLFAVSDHLELPHPSRFDHGLNSRSISDRGRETRGLGSVARSRGTVNDLDDHLGILTQNSIRQEGSIAHDLESRGRNRRR